MEEEAINEYYRLPFHSRCIRFLNLTRHGTADGGTGGWGNHGRELFVAFRGENLLVTRLRVKMSFVECEQVARSGYAQLLPWSWIRQPLS